MGAGVGFGRGDFTGRDCTFTCIFAFGLAFGLGRTGIDPRAGGGSVTTAVGAASATSSLRSMAAGATLVGCDTGLADARAATGSLPAGIPKTSATPIPRNATTKPTTTDGHHPRTNPMRPMVGSVSARRQASEQRCGQSGNFHSA